MRPFSRRLGRQRQDGSVAVEAAVSIALVLVPLLAFMLFFGRFFWYYSIAQKAAHDAALYVSSAALADIRSTDAADLAQEMMTDGLDDIDMNTLSMTESETYCLYRTAANPDVLTPRPCNSTVPPAAVKTAIGMTVTDPFLSPFTESILGYEGLFITAEATVPYVGH